MKKVLVPRVRFKGFDEEWKEEKIESFSKITIGEFVIKTKQNDFYEYPVYNGGITNTGFYKEYNNEGNKIIVSARGANAGHINFIEKKYWAGNSCYSIDLISNRQRDIKFIFYSMLINKNKFDDNKQVGTIPSVSLEDVRNFIIYFASYSEQQKIGKLLDQISNLITLEQSKLNKLKQLKETLLQKMFPEGNSKTPRIRFKGFEGEWKEERLENIYSFASEGGTPDTNKDIYYKPGLFYFTKIEDMANKYISHTKAKISELGLKNSSAWIIPKNNILFSNGATIGNVSINKVDLSTKQGIVGMIIKKKFNLEFIYYLLKSQTFQSKVAEKITVGTIPTVAIFNLKKIELFLTTKSIEQQKIGDFFSKIDNLISLYHSKLNKLKQIKDALLQKMFI
ncbi:restriction endonuclease subunit S [Mycoplasmopsis felis]|uniref:restriction endonuclease subunit S n=1 Tax=Mycoplasmopsis felis TaxID=33923 RepID=UPI002B0002F0|nr:restriction endonuclease subunit S [Mycoplasmopsis felis]WQQ06295.1 restriction endonuclease subunit S [Mycoplasmopsis felis]